MEHNTAVRCADSFEELDSTSRYESQADQNDDEGTTEYLELDFEVDTIPDPEEYYPSTPKPRRGRRSKKLLEVKSQSQASLLKWNYMTTAELKLGPKYRPIRPKPYQPSVTSRSKMFGVSSVENISAFGPSNRFIVTTPLPCKDKVKDSVVLGNSNTKLGSYIKPLNGSIGNASILTKGTNIEKNSIMNSVNVNNKKELRTTKTQAKSKGSIELFFESMAQAVINLPTHVQAEIKMEICKLVTMAEIKYSTSQGKQNYKGD